MKMAACGREGEEVGNRVAGSEDVEDKLGGQICELHFDITINGGYVFLFSCLVLIVNISHFHDRALL